MGHETESNRIQQNPTSLVENRLYQQLVQVRIDVAYHCLPLGEGKTTWENMGKLYHVNHLNLHVQVPKGAKHGSGKCLHGLHFFLLFGHDRIIHVPLRHRTRPARSTRQANGSWQSIRTSIFVIDRHCISLSHEQLQGLCMAVYLQRGPSRTTTPQSNSL